MNNSKFDIEIRTMHPYGYRSQQWATIVDHCTINNIECHKVEFSDGQIDYWVVDDPNGLYQMRVKPGPRDMVP